MSEPSMTFCLPVEGHDRPSVLSVVRWCNLCGCTIWVGEVSLARQQTEGSQLVCTSCGFGVLEAMPGELVLDPETHAQLRQLGYSNEEIHRMYLRALSALARGELP